MTWLVEQIDPNWTLRLCLSLSFLWCCGLARRHALRHLRFDYDEVADSATRSEILKVYGRPHQIRRRGSLVIPEIWKNSSRLELNDLLRMGAIFVQIEAELKIRPRFGYYHMGNLKRHEIRNDRAIRNLAIRSVRNRRKAP